MQDETDYWRSRKMSRISGMKTRSMIMKQTRTSQSTLQTFPILI